MLVISQSLIATVSRPKYHPRNRHEMWTVYDTDKKVRVYGPETRNACQKYIEENQ